MYETGQPTECFNGRDYCPTRNARLNPVKASLQTEETCDHMQPGDIIYV